MCTDLLFFTKSGSITLGAEKRKYVSSGIKVFSRRTEVLHTPLCGPASCSHSPWASSHSLQPSLLSVHGPFRAGFLLVVVIIVMIEFREVKMKTFIDEICRLISGDMNK